MAVHRSGNSWRVRIARSARGFGDDVMSPRILLRAAVFGVCPHGFQSYFVQIFSYWIPFFSLG